MKKLFSILIVMAIGFTLPFCTGNTDPAPPPERQVQEEVVEIPYELIRAENPGKEFKPMSMFPGIEIRLKEVKIVDVSRLPKDKDISYGDLETFSRPIEPTKSNCTGSKSCDFQCGNTIYRIVGIPDGCSCNKYEGGMEIYCRDCPSYDLYCRQR